MTCYLLIGSPGAGKSTYINEKFPELHVISCDQIREEHFGFSRSIDIRLSVLKILLDEISKAHLNSKKFVIDTTYFNEISTRNVLFKYIPASLISVIFIKKSLDTCIIQNARRVRHRRVNEDMIRILYKRIDYPCLEEGFKKITIIDSILVPD